MKNALTRAAFAAALLVSSSAFAQAPALIPIQGFLTDDQGEPRDGEVVLDLRLFTSSVAGDQLHAESQVVDADEGYFATEIGLGDELDLALFANNSDVWVEIEIDAEVLEPRIQFGTAPYAAWANWAGDAQTIGGVTLEELQAATDWSEITGIPADLLDGDDEGEEVDLSGYQQILIDGCPDGSYVSMIAPDGTVTCAVDVDTDTTYSAGLGLALTDTTFAVDTAIVQARVSEVCAPGSSIRSIAADGGVECETLVDTDTTYTAGAGLTLTDTTFAADTTVLQARVSSACPAGESIREINADGTVVCEEDSGADYVAGAGLELTDSTFSVSDAAPSQLAYGSGLSLPFFPNAPTATCGTPAVGGNTFGSTTSTTDLYISNMFYNESDDDTGMSHNFTRARLQLSCRGNGVIELMANCGASATPIATITCSSGARPWTAASEEFEPSTASWNLRVRATSGTLEWANPQVILY